MLLKYFNSNTLSEAYFYKTLPILTPMIIFAYHSLRKKYNFRENTTNLYLKIVYNFKLRLN